MIALVDHLWQSTLFCGAILLVTRSIRLNSAVPRMWMWRLAAVKFLLPFALLVAIGAWIGFPTAYTQVPTSPGFLARVATLASWSSPARAFDLSGTGPWLALAIGLVVAVLCVRTAWIRGRIEQVRAREESARQSRDPDDVPPGVGFIKGALLTTCVGYLIGAPLFAGALADRERRHALLITNAASLRSAPLVMTTAVPGMGTRSEVLVNEHGVLIRNANLHVLTAYAYGVSQFSVWSNQYVSNESNPDHNYWLTTPRYDLRITAPVTDPREFDPYALRQPVTKLLADRFGLEIYLNDKCQAPCGVYQVPMPDAPL